MRLPSNGNLRAIGICAAIAIGASLGVLAPAAMAAPPNDAFANREPIPSALPVAVEGSNVGATAEAGENLSGTGGDARHSVWWEWEAPASEVVSIGTCGTGFRADLGVFTGESWGELHRVVGSEAGEGPSCRAAATFRAVAGTRYDIGVDGDVSSPDPALHPGGEGPIDLQIAVLPPPAADAFGPPRGRSCERIAETSAAPIAGRCGHPRRHGAG